MKESGRSEVMKKYIYIYLYSFVDYLREDD